MTKKSFKAIFSYTIPVLAGYIFLGFAFGLLVRTKGFPIWYPSAMSIIIFSGAAEYAAVPVLSQAFNPLGSFFLSLMISLRHLFYGLPMLKKYTKERTGKLRFPLIYTLSDETFSIVSTIDPPEGVRPIFFYGGISFLNFSYWNIGTLLGAVAGDLIHFNVDGLDFALTALFIVLFLEQLKTREGVLSGFTGLLATAAALSMFGPDKMIIVAMIVILAVLIIGRKFIEHD